MDCFYPRSPCGERLSALWMALNRLLFLSTLSLRRATSRRALGFVDPDVSIHALLAESDSWTLNINGALKVSIHALLAESDLVGVAESADTGDVSIHALLAESDARRESRQHPAGEFLSTLSLRRATIVILRKRNTPSRFYPRSPCGERLLTRYRIKAR